MKSIFGTTTVVPSLPKLTVEILTAIFKDKNESFLRKSSKSLTMVFNEKILD